MGLLSTIRKQKLKDKEVRILMLGLDNSGKTTIIKSILGQDVNDISPTMGFNIETINYKKFNLNIWDIGGQNSLRPFWFNYFEKTDFLIWVIDSSSLQRLNESFNEFNKILKQDIFIGCGFLILINKIDTLINDNEINRNKLINNIIKELKLNEINNRNWNIIPVSAFTGENLNKALDWIVKEEENRYHLIPN